MTLQRVALVGCTGSVGSSVLEVCRTWPERFNLAVLAARHCSSQLEALSQEFPLASVVTEESGSFTAHSFGREAIFEATLADEIDHVVLASSGIAAAELLHRALALGKTVSLANKESAVLLGPGIAPACLSGQLRPLDSEHNALWQCLRGEKIDEVDRLTLTASGGPFLRRPLETFETITPQEATNHPVWSMGLKLTVDSATMINKGIEIIEACCLFGLPASKIEALILPGSLVHGAVAFQDGSLKMLASQPTMQLAAMNCLCFPERLPLKLQGVKPVDLTRRPLVFESPEKARFPGYFLAHEAACRGGVWPVILLAADQAAVEAFLEKQLPFTAMAGVLEQTMASYDGENLSSLEERQALYLRALSVARDLIAGKQTRWTL